MYTVKLTMIFSARLVTGLFSKLSIPVLYSAGLKRWILLVAEAVGHYSLNMNILKFNALENRPVMGYPTIILVSLN